MTKEELFEQCKIDESHSKWESIDSWNSVEIYRITHGGCLPAKGDLSTRWIYDFNITADEYIKKINFDSLFLTSKRLIYKLYKDIIEDLNKYDGNN